jgi:dihydroorotase
MPEFRDWEEINQAATEAAIEANRNIIKGIKFRLVGKFVARVGAEPVRIAKKIASRFGLPIMVHIGDTEGQVPPSVTRELLPLMEAGDILSHIFTARQGGVLRPDGTVLPELPAAIRRGVVLDIAHGRYNFSYEVARKGIAQGILPTTISTDVVIPSLTGPVYGLAVTMSKLLALGLSLRQVIEMTTINPARALKIDHCKGSLKPGMDADVSILELLPGAWQLTDAEHQTLIANQLIAPGTTIKRGQPIAAKPVAQPPRLD